MIETCAYHAVLFKSVNQTMWAEKILKGKGIPHKLIPVPRYISSDCGVCLRITAVDMEETMSALRGIEGFSGIVQLRNITQSF